MCNANFQRERVVPNCCNTVHFDWSRYEGVCCIIIYQMMSAPAEKYWSNIALLRLSAMGFGVSGVYLALDTMLLPVLVLAVASEELKNTFLGVLGFSGLLVAALVQLVVGRLSDRTHSPLGRRIPYLLWGAIFSCVGIAGFGYATRYLGSDNISFAAKATALVVVWLFIQLNFNIAYGPYQALIRDLVPVGRIGVAASFKILMDAAGAVAMIAVSGALIGRYAGPDSIKWLWLTLGVLGVTVVISTAITILTVRSREAPSIGKAAATPPTESRFHPQLKRFLLSRFLMFTAVFIFPTYGLFFLRDMVGLENPARALGILILPIGGALALSVYPAGWLSDKVGRKPLVLAGAVGAAVGTIAMLWADTTIEVLIIATAIGISVGVLLSASWALANDLGTAGREAQHMGMVTIATVAGAGVAKIIGPLVDLLNQASPGWGYSGLLISCAVLFLVGALLLMPLKADLRPAVSPEAVP